VGNQTKEYTTMTQETLSRSATRESLGRDNPMVFARQTWIIFRRQMRLALRNPAWVITDKDPIIHRNIKTDRDQRYLSE